MRISYLELKDYRRFRQLKLQFPDGIVGILGLNGVGKTTLIEGAAWALFGNVDEVVRTSREGIRRAGAASSDSCSAVLEFELGDAEYRIEREMGGKNLTMRAELRNKDKILAQGDKPVREMVQRLIGMDHKSFFTSVFARQKELNALQNVAAGERKKVVLRMLRIDGIDSVLTNVRADKKERQARIEGAEKTLITEDGREREKVLVDAIPELERGHSSAVAELELAEKREREVTKEFDQLKLRRNDLKKDVDAYNSAIGDLKAKQSQIKEMKSREKSLEARLFEANEKLSRLPGLEEEDKAWRDVGAKKERLDRDKANNGKAKMLEQDIESDQKELKRRLEEITQLKAGKASPDELAAKQDETEKAKTDCQVRRSEIATKIGELRAKISEKKEAASRDRKKLDEIRSAGKKGTCPTCERTLEEAYELLVKKLSESSAESEKTVKETSEIVATLETELGALSSKEEALRKRATILDKEHTRIRQLETSLEMKEGELAGFRTRIEEKGKALRGLGDTAFSEEEYASVVRDFERLKHVHDEFVGLASLKTQVSHYSKDLDDIRTLIKKSLNEEKQFAEITETLEPKKSMFEATMKELDEKISIVNSTKDSVKKASLQKERTRAELERTRKEIEEITRVKKAIGSDRRMVDDLALLEDVLANFKDHLIGRIAPALSALTSRNLDAMTESKYSRVELDENYEMQVDDQGTMYPLSRFSGGESDLANLSLRLAISGIIADRTGASPMNLLILDEIFGSQDPNRKRSVMTALSRLSAQYRQIFLITHIEDIKDSLSSVIRVEEQEDGTSKAVLVN
jgi:exonuclease SbcC